MNIDHHLQLEMLQRLLESDQAIRYSDLKSGDTENSLFSYHLNKLIDRNMVEKKDEAYILTTEGARWLHNNGLTIRPKDAPRVFIALVIENSKGEFLIGQRTGQLKVKINDYILPSCLYENDSDLETQIINAADAFIPREKVVKRADYGFVQIKASYKDDVTLRNLFSVTHYLTQEFAPLNNQQQNSYQWLCWDEIEQIDHPSASILRGIIKYVQDQHNQHIAPTIAG